MNKSKIAYTIVGLIILIALVYVVIVSTKPAVTYATTTISPAVSGYSVLLQLTDPPEVPNGTQSLNITYSNVYVHITGPNATRWVSANTSGKLDLLTIVNISKTIGSVVIPKNTTIDMMKFNITSASISINNTAYPVALPNSTVLVHIAGRVNASSTLLADLSPTVVTIVTNSSTPVFVMVPSVKAVIIPGISQSAKSTGYSPVNESIRERLEHVKPNITITSASISSTGNDTSISLTVKNNANTSVVLRSVLIFGNESMHVYFNFTNPLGGFGFGHDNRPMPAVPTPPTFGMNTSTIGTIANSISSIISTNISSFNSLNLSKINANTIGIAQHMLGGMNLNESDIQDFVNEAEHRHVFNATAMQNIIRNITHNSSLSIPALEHMNESQIEELINRTIIAHRMEIEHEHFRVVNFLILSNGTLAAPFSMLDAENEYYRSGYAIAPGSTATLKFNGELTIGNSNVVVTFNNGEVYKIVIAGEEGARATTNVIAS